MTLLTDDIRAMVGQEVTYVAPDEVSRAAIRYFALACGDDNPLWRDDEYARRHGRGGMIAPPTFVCETNYYVGHGPDEEGYAGHLWSIPVEGCHMLRGGHEYELYRPLRPEDRLKVTWRLTDIVEKTGSTGRAMLIVTSEARISDVGGDLIALNRDTMIYQQAL